MNRRLGSLAAGAIVMTACTGLRRGPLTTGSPDFNGGRAHEEVFANLGPAAPFRANRPPFPFKATSAPQRP